MTLVKKDGMARLEAVLRQSGSLSKISFAILERTQLI